jgi:branched-chain amino acid transport system ATP-binding protein
VGVDDPALEVVDVTVAFGGLVALDRVGFGVEAGTVVGVIGPNGAGKTTLFNVIAGIQPPTRGHVLVGGTDVSALRPHRRARLGLARTFQRLEVFGTLSVRDNLLVAAEAHGRRGGSRDPATVTARLLDRLALSDVADTVADSLPTGTQRLVELGRALAGGPRVLLLDEAASGLSEPETAATGALLRDLADEGLTIVLVEHDMAFVMGLCDRVVMLDHGVLVADGTPAEVRAHPAVQEAYLGHHEVVR